MLKPINKNLNHVANLGRSSFDMSKDIKFTSSVGHLLPVYWDILNPGDKIKIGSSIFTRTKPLATPAFVSIEEHVDYFFVPMRQLYKFFDNKMTDISVFDTTFVHELRKTVDLPTLNLSQIAITFRDSFHDEQEALRSLFENFGVPYWMDFLRLIDLLGINYKPFYDFIVGKSQSYEMPYVPSSFLDNINVFPFLAYHKIFFDHYRNDEFTPNDPELYNADNFETYSFSGDAEDFVKLHYAPWKRDFFTNIHSSPLVSSLNSLGLTFNPKDYPNVNVLTGYVTDGSGSSGGLSDNNTFDSNSAGSGGPTATNLNAIRAMYAYDKLLRITQFAPKDVDAQIAAHFGWKVPQGVDGRVVYLGSDDSRIDIGEVAATSDTLSSDGSTGAQLGALAGKGAGYREGKAVHEYTAPCHGILMAVYSALPTADYQNNFDKLLMYVDINNYYRPEFENLGLQPLFASQMQVSSNSNPFPTDNHILGFQYRWSELKQKFSTIHGDFLDTLPDWVVNRNKQSLQQPNTDPSINYSWLYCNPCAIDSITEVNFAPLQVFPDPPVEPTPEDWDDTVFTRDPLMHWITFHSYKTSSMSMYDLPTL